MFKKKSVTAFIDWNSQIINAGQQTEPRKPRQALATAEYVSAMIAAKLREFTEADIFDVTMRLYHGWYGGLTETENFSAIKTVIRERLIPSRAGKAIFDWRQPFSHTLLGADEHRLHSRLRVHLPDSCRENLKGGQDRREKMVDTALVCDLLASARSEPQEVKVIMAEDDDPVPGIFVAEKWIKSHGGKILLIRKRESSAHLCLGGLLWKLETSNAR